MSKIGQAILEGQEMAQNYSEMDAYEFYAFMANSYGASSIHTEAAIDEYYAINGMTPIKQEDFKEY